MPTKPAAIGALLFLLLAPVAGNGAVVLYDPTAGNRPQDQDWLTYFNDSLTSPHPSVGVATGGIDLDTTGQSSDAAGFFNHGVTLVSLFPPVLNWTLKNPAFPELDPVAGFRLGFELLIRDEDHLSNHRAGFSVILLGSDNKGIELGFWEDHVWAQSGPAFTRAESVEFDTTAASRLYELTILGELYSLTADGDHVLSGAVRDYTPADPFPDPYDVPNMLFLGDDTGSAGADFRLGRITLATGPLPAVPAPPAWPLLTGGLLWLAVRRRHALERPMRGPTLS